MVSCDFRPLLDEKIESTVCLFFKKETGVCIAEDVFSFGSLFTQFPRRTKSGEVPVSFDGFSAFNGG